MATARLRPVVLPGLLYVAALWTIPANAQDVMPAEMVSSEVTCAPGPQFFARASAATGPILVVGTRVSPDLSELPIVALLGHLALTERQSDQIFAILHDASLALRSSRKTLDRLQQQLKAISSSPSYSRNDSAALAHALGAAAEESARLRIDIDREIAGILTPAQRRAIDGRPASPPPSSNAPR